MQSKITTIILSILAVILSLSTGIATFTVYKQNKKYQKAVEEKEIILAQWNKMIRTPPRVTVVTRTITVKPLIHYTPIPIQNDTTHNQVQKDSAQTVVCPDLCYTWYREKNSIGDSVFVYWAANTYGHIEWFNLDSVTYPYRTKTIETIVIEPPETLEKKKIKNHYGFYIGAFAKDLKQFPNLQLGLTSIFKDKWGFQVGPIYMPNMEAKQQWYLSVNGLFYFR